MHDKLSSIESKIAQLSKKILAKTTECEPVKEKEASRGIEKELRVDCVEEPVGNTVVRTSNEHRATIETIATEREELESVEASISLSQTQNAEPQTQLDEVDQLTAVVEKSSIESNEKTVIEEKVSAKKKVSPPKNYEKIIGENLFSKIGILVLVVGIGSFIKYAIDHEWINETMRCILGYGLGIALLMIAQKLRKNYRTFSSLLAGGTFAIFYVTTALSYHYYSLFSQEVAFAILLGTTISMITLSMLYDRKELSTISLIGGFLAPFIVSTGEGSAIVLFSYITILNISMLIISLKKKWAELPLLCFLFTYIIIYSFQFLDASSSTAILSFLTMFYLIFLVSIWRIYSLQLSQKWNLIYSAIFGTNNFLYLALAMYTLSDMGFDIKIQGIIPIGIAAINAVTLAITKKYTTQRVFNRLKLIMLGVIVTFLTLSVPIQLEGNYLIVVWAIEMVILLVLYIKTRIKLYSVAALILYIITGLSVFMSFSGVDVTIGSWVSLAIIGATFFIAAHLLRRNKEVFNESAMPYIPFNPLYIFSGIISYAIIILLANEFVQSSQVTLSIYFVYITLLIYILPRRFDIQRNINLYLVGVGLFVLLSVIHSNELPFYLYAIQMICVGASLVKIAQPFIQSGAYRNKENKSRVIVFNMLIYVTCCYITISSFYAYLDLSWSISIILAIIAFAQILIGMRKHFKLLRVIGIYCFGLVLLKLLLVDLWVMSSAGKIATLILLGVTLLILSFLYQRLKNVLFEDESSTEKIDKDDKE